MRAVLRNEGHTVAPVLKKSSAPVVISWYRRATDAEAYVQELSRLLDMTIARAEAAEAEVKVLTQTLELLHVRRK